MKEKKDTCCLGKLLKVIDILQRNASGSDCFDESCTRPYLGSSPNIICFNTRPVTFYTRFGNIFSTTYTIDGNTNTSSVFRVESVDNCCVKCRILRPNPDTTDVTRAYLATNEFITINLDCICVVSCLDDIIIDNL